MRRKPPSGMYLMSDGEIVCWDCLDPSTDELEKELLVGDTYADDPCDRCEQLPKVQWGDLGPFGCRCQTLHHRVAGDGCDICNPSRSSDL